MGHETKERELENGRRKPKGMVMRNERKRTRANDKENPSAIFINLPR